VGLLKIKWGISVYQQREERGKHRTSNIQLYKSLCSNEATVLQKEYKCTRSLKEMTMSAPKRTSYAL
jgi:hypothetical protein